jgi:hypothetical protein
VKFLEEAFFSWSIILILGADGAVSGFYNPAFDKSRRKLAERRMLTLREIGERTSAARDVKSFWGHVLKGLEDKHFDFPYVILYSVSDDPESDMSSIHSSNSSGGRQCLLEGTLGVPEGHRAAPERIDLRTGTEGFVGLFREAMATENPSLVQAGDGNMPPDMLNGIEIRGYPEPCRDSVVCPIYPTWELDCSSKIL